MNKHSFFLFSSKLLTLILAADGGASKGDGRVDWVVT